MNLQYDIISRAAQIVQVLFRLLLEMNHEVRGEARQESVDQVRSLEIGTLDLAFCNLKVLNSDPDFFSRFQLVIVCGLPEKTLATVSSLCWQVRSTKSRVGIKISLGQGNLRNF